MIIINHLLHVTFHYHFHCPPLFYSRLKIYLFHKSYYRLLVCITYWTALTDYNFGFLVLIGFPFFFVTFFVILMSGLVYGKLSWPLVSFQRTLNIFLIDSIDCFIGHCYRLQTEVKVSKLFI